MATDTGLFGPTPWEVQQTQNQQVNDYAANFARMSPFEKAGMLMGKAGAGITGAVAPMLGGVNVPQQQAAQNQQALQGADLQTPEGLRAAAKKMLDIGNQKAAYALAQKATELEKDQADINYKKALATKAENYRAPGSQDPETVKLLDRMTELETLGLQDGPEYKALEGRVKFLQTAKGGTSGNSSSVQLTKIVDPVTGAVQMVRMEKGIGGKTEVVTVDGKPLTPAEYSPAVKALVAQSSAGGKEIGTQSAQAMMQLPKIEQQSETIKALGAQLFAHPGYQQLVGAGFPGLKSLAGSNVPGAAALFGNIQGIAYLMAREELRGQGQVTEGEANMALAAFNRMNTTMNEKDFRAAYNDFVQRVENVKSLLKTRSTMTYQSPGLNMPQVSTLSNTAPMPQGVAPQTPVAPMSTPFKLTLNNKNEVKAAYKAGKFGPVGSQEALNAANTILNQME